MSMQCHGVVAMHGSGYKPNDNIRIRVYQEAQVDGPFQFQIIS